MFMFFDMYECQRRFFALNTPTNNTKMGSVPTTTTAIPTKATPFQESRPQHHQQLEQQQLHKNVPTKMKFMNNNKNIQNAQQHQKCYGSNNKRQQHQSLYNNNNAMHRKKWNNVPQQQQQYELQTQKKRQNNNNNGNNNNSVVKNRNILGSTHQSAGTTSNVEKTLEFPELNQKYCNTVNNNNKSLISGSRSNKKYNNNGNILTRVVNSIKSNSPSMTELLASRKISSKPSLSLVQDLQTSMPETTPIAQYNNITELSDVTFVNNHKNAGLTKTNNKLTDGRGNELNINGCKSSISLSIAETTPLTLVESLNKPSNSKSQRIHNLNKRKSQYRHNNPQNSPKQREQQQPHNQENDEDNKIQQSVHRLMVVGDGKDLPTSIEMIFTSENSKNDLVENSIDTVITSSSSLVTSGGPAKAKRMSNAHNEKLQTTVKKQLNRDTGGNSNTQQQQQQQQQQYTYNYQQQEQHHYYPQPQQLTIASFLQKELLVGKITNNQHKDERRFVGGNGGQILSQQLSQPLSQVQNQHHEQQQHQDQQNQRYTYQLQNYGQGQRLNYRNNNNNLNGVPQHPQMPYSNHNQQHMHQHQNQHHQHHQHNQHNHCMRRNKYNNGRRNGNINHGFMPLSASSSSMSPGVLSSSFCSSNRSTNQQFNHHNRQQAQQQPQQTYETSNINLLQQPTTQNSFYYHQQSHQYNNNGIGGSLHHGVTYNGATTPTPQHQNFKNLTYVNVDAIEPVLASTTPATAPAFITYSLSPSVRSYMPKTSPDTKVIQITTMPAEVNYITHMASTAIPPPSTENSYATSKTATTYTSLFPSTHLTPTTEINEPTVQLSSLPHPTTNVLCCAQLDEAITSSAAANNDPSTTVLRSSTPVNIELNLSNSTVLKHQPQPALFQQQQQSLSVVLSPNFNAYSVYTQQDYSQQHPCAAADIQMFTQPPPSPPPSLTPMQQVQTVQAMQGVQPIQTVKTIKPELAPPAQKYYNLQNLQQQQQEQHDGPLRFGFGDLLCDGWVNPPPPSPCCHKGAPNFQLPCKIPIKRRYSLDDYNSIEAIYKQDEKSLFQDNHSIKSRELHAKLKTLTPLRVPQVVCCPPPGTERHVIPPDRFISHAKNIESKGRPKDLIQRCKFDSLSEDMWHKFLEVQQKNDRFKTKLRLWRLLYLMIKQSYPRCGLYLVGSSMTGFGLDSSDIDICLIVRHMPSERMEALCQLYLLRGALKLADFKLIEARVPILRFTENIHEIEVDLNFNNSVGIKNTHLLRLYSQLDWRARPLVLIVKLWARYHAINDAKNMTISSYSLVLMVIHFLQYGCYPHILPCLHTLFPDRFSIGWDDYAHLDLNETISTYQTDNRETLGELFIGFLHYYSHFDYRNNAISIRTGGLLPVALCRSAKSSKNEASHWRELCIEEPFDLTNTARSTYDYQTFQRVKAVFIQSWLLIKDTLDLNSVFIPLVPVLPNQQEVKNTESDFLESKKDEASYAPISTTSDYTS